MNKFHVFLTDHAMPYAGLFVHACGSNIVGRATTLESSELGED